MTGAWKVYFLAIVSFLVGTSEYIISGILDKIADSLGITITAAGQLITIFSMVYAILTPILMALTAKVERRKLLVYSLGIFVIANVLSYALPVYSVCFCARSYGDGCRHGRCHRARNCRPNRGSWQTG